jgi:hypothetical protein
MTVTVTLLGSSDYPHDFPAIATVDVSATRCQQLLSEPPAQTTKGAQEEPL